MFEPTSSSGWHLSRRERICLAVLGLVLLGLLGIAGGLKPDPSGLGTHQQLGLPPCTVLSMFGIRCPACGMTTSWAYFVRGHWLAAGEANAGGALLAFSAGVGGLWFVGSAVRGRWIVTRPADWIVLLYCTSILLVTLVHWLIRIVPDIWR